MGGFQLKGKEGDRLDPVLCAGTGKSGWSLRTIQKKRCRLFHARYA
jgi:hypothetical protein